MREIPCRTCKGARLKPESLAVTIGGLNIWELTRQAIKDEVTFLDELELSERLVPGLSGGRTVGKSRPRLGGGCLGGARPAIAVAALGTSAPRRDQPELVLLAEPFDGLHQALVPGVDLLLHGPQGRHPGQHARAADHQLILA